MTKNQLNDLSEVPKKTDKKTEDDDFYKELDEKKSHQSCCTFRTMIIFFFFIFFIFAGVVFYLYFQITRGGLFASLDSKLITKNVSNKIKSLSPEASGTVILTLEDDELASLLNYGISGDDFILNNLSASINPDNILFYGNLTKPLGSRVVFTAVPKVINGKVNFEVTKVSAGKINLPSFLNQKISDRLNENFDSKMSLFYKNYNTKKITLKQNQMIIEGNIK